MTNKAKKWYGIAAFAPVVYFIIMIFALIICLFFFVFTSIKNGDSKDMPIGSIIGFVGVYVMFILGIMFSFIIRILFVIKAITNNRLDTEKKLLWGFLLFMSVLSTPFYWYYHIWKEIPAGNQY